ncbi:hypothetical protein TSA1_15875 [Bradyrhizobium nitroreducens]|uniref:Uncharacterized protein n=1 Tax=Bradyrhizobium nitroreducens TaxID=709803 RepID=A0A2M6UBU9_9BRAD|nr:hypothetical protein TSA1_15875 [Bradyrhizobium nitroreducens]
MCSTTGKAGRKHDAGQAGFIVASACLSARHDNLTLLKARSVETLFMMNPARLFLDDVTISAGSHGKHIPVREHPALLHLATLARLPTRALTVRGVDTAHRLEARCATASFVNRARLGVDLAEPRDDLGELCSRSVVLAKQGNCPNLNIIARILDALAEAFCLGLLLDRRFGSERFGVRLFKISEAGGSPVCSPPVHLIFCFGFLMGSIVHQAETGQRCAALGKSSVMLGARLLNFGRDIGGSNRLLAKEGLQNAHCA